MRVTDLCNFIREREKVRLHKEANKGRTEHAMRGLDPIITKYRFCNVRRNDDRVSQYVHKFILEPNKDCPYLWFRLTVARLLNLPASLEAVKHLLVPFKPEQFRRVLHARKADGHNVFNAAYIVSTNGRTMDKIDYIVAEVLGPLWALRSPFNASLRGLNLAGAHDLLMRQNGLGSFMAAQILADLKYADPMKWVDFDTFAASGPGSKRGMNRVLGRDINTPIREGHFREHLATLRKKVNARLKYVPSITAQDLQNCLCEFDKYERARTGEGKPKQLYTPNTDLPFHL